MRRFLVTLELGYFGYICFIIFKHTFPLLPFLMVLYLVDVFVFSSSATTGLGASLYVIVYWFLTLCTCLCFAVAEKIYIAIFEKPNEEES